MKRFAQVRIAENGTPFPTSLTKKYLQVVFPASLVLRSSETDTTMFPMELSVISLLAWHSMIKLYHRFKIWDQY